MTTEKTPRRPRAAATPDTAAEPAAQAAEPPAQAGPADTVVAAQAPASGAPPAAGASATASLSDIQVAKLLQLIKGSDSVELKVTVPADEHVATIRGLPIDPVESQLRQVYFFDTPDLALDRAGVVVRARRSTGGRGDTVVKLRPVVPEQLPPELRRSASFNVEVDVLPGGFVCSGSLKGRATGQAVRDAVTGAMAIPKLFAKEQRAFFAKHAPEGITLDQLSVLGPTFVLKSIFQADVSGLGPIASRKMVAEVWLYPDGTRILELSLKCLPSEAFQVAAETRAYLAGQGVNLHAGAQQTKTRTALAFYAGQLQAAAAGAG